MSAGCPWAEALRGVPAGRVRVVQPEPGPGRAPARGDGRRGRIEAYRVFPGIDAAFGMFCASRAAFRHEAREEVLSLDYCCARPHRLGSMRCGAAVYLGQGDLSLHSQACCADSSMTFPLGFAAEVSLSVDLGALARACPEILPRRDLTPRRCARGSAAGRVLPAGRAQSLRRSSPLLRAPGGPAGGLPRAQEPGAPALPLAAGGGAPALQRVHAQQTEQVRKVHAFLVSHLDRRYTIEDLSRQFLLNTATLKSTFKAVYGQPIATYMKEARVREAMRLLRETDSSIADIAAAVGYESQGKFTKAFKDVAQALPTEYRRQHRA